MQKQIVEYDIKERSISKWQNKKMTKVDRATLKAKKAQAEYRRWVREEKDNARTAQDRHKYMMSGRIL